ncbi:MAG: PilZ domain-containing protein [Plesiomonas sp.]|uniref:PilZ domain-containing protein n=1 Tax=Plesiomonas sp. TaxID=2486279 RepID=UPI003F32775A
MHTTLPNEFAHILQQLIPLGVHAELDPLLKKLLPQSSASERLHIKMAYRQLHTPCYRPLDLRNRVDGRCHEHQINGLTHWLDDVALNIFQQQIALFQNVYTQGVYDAVMQANNNYRNMRQQTLLEKTAQKAAPTSEPELKKDLPTEVTVARFGYQFMRNEARLHYHCQVVVTCHETQQIAHGVTVDISLAGLCIRVPHSLTFKLGQEFTIQFNALGEKLEQPTLERGLNYLLVGIDRQDQRQLLRLHISEPNPALHRLMSALARSGSKKVRLNVDGLLTQLHLRGLEQSYLNATATLPLLISQQGTVYALLSQNNRESYQYWHDENYQPVLGQFFTPERLQRICPPGVSCVKSLLYSFIHRQNGRTYFYCAMSTELTQAEQRELFWHVGAHRPSFRVQRLIIRPLSADDFSPHPEQQRLITEHQLNELRYLVLLQDLSSCTIQADYQQTPLPNLPLNQLNVFCLPRAYSSTFEVNMSQEQRRRAPRYRYQTEVHVTSSDQRTTIGYTVDFSAVGLRIVLGKPLNIKRNQVLLLHFPAWQVLDKHIALHTLPYQVLYINAEQDQLVLTATEPHVAHTGVQFIQRLIAANLKSLQEDVEQQTLPEIIDIFRQITVPHLASIPIFVVQDGHIYRPTAIGMTPATYTLNRRLGQGQTDTLLLALLDVYWSQLVIRPLNEPFRSHPTEHKIYLSLHQEKWQYQLQDKKLDTELNDKNALMAFIQQAKQQGEFIALRFQLTRYKRNTLHPNLLRDFEQLIKANLSQAKMLEQELLALTAMIELTDCTEEVLLRVESEQRRIAIETLTEML